MASQINPSSERQMGKYVSRDVKHPTLEVYQRRENHSSGFMVWDGASFNGKTKLHFVDPGAKVNSTYYINNVLKPFLTKDALRLYSDGDFAFHNDSAPSHVSKITTEFMKGKLKFISQEKWMSKSPDAAPMDYFVRSYMKQQLWRTKAKDVAALKRAVKRVWKDMPQELVGAGIMTEALVCKQLSNWENLGKENVQVQHAKKDADEIIVSTAISQAAKLESVAIVSEDIDVLILLTGLANAYEDLYFLKPEKGKKQVYGRQQLPLIENDNETFSRLEQVEAKLRDEEDSK
ncbi:hypothetical protein ILUMI_09261 [Ignelater luminosus]|uniref:Transposase n=1 Tax=Ignelater luminosus TaxID=2038154 RepID=A0A8K0D050_IGNLU|nr:hypothetical protein ILUMI_09261 [Ignelater luminosus]